MIKFIDENNEVVFIIDDDDKEGNYLKINKDKKKEIIVSTKFLNEKKESK